MRICPCRSVSMRSGSFARRGSAAISTQRFRLNLVCDLRSGSSIIIGTPARYARNGKRHKTQNRIRRIRRFRGEEQIRSPARLGRARRRSDDCPSWQGSRAPCSCPATRQSGRGPRCPPAYARPRGTEQARYFRLARMESLPSTLGLRKFGQLIDRSIFAEKVAWFCETGIWPCSQSKFTSSSTRVTSGVPERSGVVKYWP